MQYKSKKTNKNKPKRERGRARIQLHTVQQKSILELSIWVTILSYFLKHLGETQVYKKTSGNQLAFTLNLSLLNLKWWHYQCVQHDQYGQYGEHTPQCQLAYQSSPHDAHWEYQDHGQPPEINNSKINE